MKRQANYDLGGQPLRNPLDVHKAIKSRELSVSSTNIVCASSALGISGSDDILDVSQWLPFASKCYNISSDLNDYVMVPIITIPTDLPNRNGVAFPLSEMVAFNPDAGMQAFKTFKGKPTFIEHKNAVVANACGVIVDTYLRKMTEFGQNKVWKFLELLAFDRTKNPDLVKDILSGSMNSYSMGAYVDAYSCSYCGKKMGKCSHISANKPVDFYRKDNKLVYRQVHGIMGFETSAVGAPAFYSAIQEDKSLLSLG